MRSTILFGLSVVAVACMCPVARAQDQVQCPATRDAAISLFNLEREYGVAELVLLSHCRQPLAREFAIAALANAEPEPAAIGVVVDALDDDAETVRRQAVFSIGAIGKPAVERLMEAIVADDVSDRSVGDRRLTSRAAARRIAAISDLNLERSERSAFASRLVHGGDTASAFAAPLFPQVAAAPASVGGSWRADDFHTPIQPSKR